MSYKAVVLGSSGFVGRALSSALEMRGFEVIGVNSGAHSDNGAPNSIRVHSVDASQPKLLANLLEPGSTLISCLSSTSPLEETIRPLFDSPNFLRRLIEVAASRGVQRFAYCSSGGTVYGNHSEHSASESTELNPISTYGRAKVLGEGIVTEECLQRRVVPVIWRFSNLYGPGQRSSSGQGLIARAVHLALNSRRVEIYGDGTMVRDFVHVEDAASAAACTLEKRLAGITVNIGSGEGKTVLEVLKLVEREAGTVLEKVFLEKPKWFVEKNILDISALRKACPSVKFRSVEDGISQLLQS